MQDIGGRHVEHAPIERRRHPVEVPRRRWRLECFRRHGSGLLAADPRRTCAQCTHEEPCVGAAHNVLDPPPGDGAASAGSLELIERLGIEDVVAGEERKHDEAWPMASDVVAEDQMLLLRTEAGRSVVLHGHAEAPFELRRPRLVHRQRHGIGE